MTSWMSERTMRFFSRSIGIGRLPDFLEPFGQARELLHASAPGYSCRADVLRDASLDLTHSLERLVPPALELVGDESVLGIGGIVLTLSALRRVAGRLEIALERSSHFVLFVRFFSVCQDRCLDRGRLHHTQ